MRHTKESHLCGLRKRICTLFIQFVKTPAFNPEAAQLNKVPHDPSKLRCNIFYCPSCSQYLPAAAFSLSCSSRSIQRCRGCLALDNMARARLDLSLYRRMLRSLQLAEAAYSDRSQMAFLLAEGDIRYLVQHVWGGQSVLSGCQDLQDLCLVRWQSAVHWSPWNCLLLTQEEAKSHAKIDDLVQHYGEVFIDKVSYKHTLAKNHFSHLAHLAKVTSQKGSDTMSPAPSTLGTSFVNRRSQTV